MREFTIVAFDQFINNAVSHYTPTSLNDRLGSADELILFAVTTQRAGTPTLTCQVETSANGTHWTAAAGTPEINAASVLENTASYGHRDAFAPPLLTFVRIKITLAGSGSPACHLRLYVTGRASRRTGTAGTAAPGGNGGARPRGAQPGRTCLAPTSG